MNSRSGFGQLKAQWQQAIYFHLRGGLDTHACLADVQDFAKFGDCALGAAAWAGIGGSMDAVAACTPTVATEYGIIWAPVR
jgi:hypothetical protein